MIPFIPGYTIQGKEVHAGARMRIFHAVRDVDNQAVVIKILKNEHPSVEEIERFKHEYEITRRMNNSKDIIHAYSFEKYQNTYAIILENVNAPSLATVLSQQQKIPVSEFLDLAILITKGLEQIHQANVIHKDISPANILYNAENKTIKIIDFGLAATLPRERANVVSANVLEGTLAYISPEQTGRMNRGIDYRTDFYSLGVTFYQLLTGQLPFPTVDPMELVHCHIAVVPKAPHEIDPAIPEMLSLVVMKLLAKTAEDRYQNTYETLSDLKICLDQLWRTGGIAAFTLGSQDIFNRFQIPEKLYGRAQEVNNLMMTYEKVTRGNVELMLVSGYSGIGKSALVHEIYKPVVAKRSHFVSGKFEQFKHNIPYFGLTQALNEFIKQVLAESEEEIAVFRERILANLGENGQVIVDVVPNLTAIIGTQPSVPELGFSENQNRFSRVFQNFIRSLAVPEHPLVLFLDDLQWADLSSLKILEFLLTSLDCHYLFIIGAYRSNEVNDAHPLMDLLRGLEKKNIPYQSIILGPLALEHVSELLADALHQNHTAVSSLAELCYEKTRGNPFFLIQLLQTLYKEQLIEFDSQANQWTWYLDKIREKQVTDNVVHLMIDNIRQLSLSAQHIIQLAACIGNNFNLDVLSFITDKTPEKILSDIQEILKEGYIFSYGTYYVAGSYKFSHDRIQQAAYLLLEEPERKNIHIQLARLLLKNTSEEKLSEIIFDIVNHFNIGIDPVVPDNIEEAERKKMADLNLQASKMARSAAAYEPALKYAEYGLKCLDENAWQSDYKLMLELYTKAIEASYLSAKFDLMEKYAEAALRQAKTVFDELRIIEIRALSCVAQMQPLAAIDMIIEALARLGVTISKKPKKIHVFVIIMKIKLLLASKRIPDLLNLPEMTDLTQKAALRLLVSACSACYISRPDLFPFVVGESVILSLRYGNARESAYAYAAYGIIACGILNDIEHGYQFGELALKLVDKMREEESKTKVYFLNFCFIEHWKDHIHGILPKLADNFVGGFDRGDLEYACYSARVLCYDAFFSGMPLKDVLIKMETYKQSFQYAGQMVSYDYVAVWQQAVLNLTETGREVPDQLIGVAYDEIKMIPDLVKAKNNHGLFCIYFNKMMLAYFFEQKTNAIQHLKNADLYAGSTVASFTITLFNFFKFLILISTYAGNSFKEKRKIKKILLAIQKKMRLWAKHAPSNHLHKYLLIKAEWASIHGELEQAAELYDEAISAAKQNEFLNEEALANKLAAKFYLKQGKHKIAKAYMEEAYHAYQMWGAYAKVAHLKQHYSILLEQEYRGNILKHTSSSVFATTSSLQSLQRLDINTIQEFSQAMSSSIVLDKLLEKLMSVLLAHTSAEKIYLLLNRKGKYFIEAEWQAGWDQPIVLQSLKVTYDILPDSIIHDVIHKKKSIVLGHVMESDYRGDAYIVKKRPKSILCMPLLRRSGLTGILYFENNSMYGAFSKEGIHIIKLLLAQIAISIDNAKLFTRLKELNEHLFELNKAYERFVPRDFLNLLKKKSIVDVNLGDQVQEIMTILLLDIRDFTAKSEKMTPQENFDFLNSFLGVMSPIIRKHNGFVDKYIGDAIMALYPNQADDALRSALEMQRVLEQYNGEYPEREPIKIGIGIHTDLLTLGTVGVKHRMNAAVIFDAANIVSRVESLTKKYDVPMLITEQTYKNLKNPAEYHIEKVDSFVFEGRQKKITIYKVN